MKNFFRRGIILILICIFAYSSYNLYLIFNEYKKNKDSYNEISEIVIKEDKEIKIKDEEYTALKNKNHDYLFWLNIPETNVNYPVVQSKDNEDYLYKNFDFCNRNDFFHNLYSKKIIEQSQLSAVSGMFSQLGYRNAKRENEYIARCIAELQYKTEFYRQNYTQNGKTNRMCGLSVGIVIMIMLF